MLDFLNINFISGKSKSVRMAHKSRKPSDDISSKHFHVTNVTRIPSAEERYEGRYIHFFYFPTSPHSPTIVLFVR